MGEMRQKKRRDEARRWTDVFLQEGSENISPLLWFFFLSEALTELGAEYMISQFLSKHLDPSSHLEEVGCETQEPEQREVGQRSVMMLLTSGTVSTFNLGLKTLLFTVAYS